MCLSSVYKEKTLGDDDMDVIYLNGWVAVFQFMASLLFAVPSAYAMGLPINVSRNPMATNCGCYDTYCPLSRHVLRPDVPKRVLVIYVYCPDSGRELFR